MVKKTKIWKVVFIGCLKVIFLERQRKAMKLSKDKSNLPKIQNYYLPKYVYKGRAEAQRLDTGFPPLRPGFVYGRHWGRFSPSTSVSPANHSTVFSIIITRG
jgi:hypothetical protein